MKEIAPYTNSAEAMEALDNGGRFYNLMSKANDGLITKAELAKVGGLFNDAQKMMLFLDMSLSKLDAKASGGIRASLEPSLQKAYQKYQPKWLSIPEANSIEHLASGLIVKGIPTLKESKSEFSGFIMVPISTGSTTTFTMIPLIDQYDVYELRDEESAQNFLIAHARGKKKLPQKTLQVAGILKELKSQEEEQSPQNVFLEVVYHMDAQ